jgi:hypothetical protein
MNDRHLQKYVDYIKATGQPYLPIKTFDDDWDPIGHLIRQELVAAGYAREMAGIIRIIQEPINVR